MHRSTSSFSKWVSLQKDAQTEDRPQNRHWPHTPEALERGSVVYVVKYYGAQVVEEAKGVAPVKDAIRRMKFHKQLRKAEGQKSSPKVELCINVDGLVIQEVKTKMEMHKFRLHHISYCAEDKTEKKLFTFIARDAVKRENLCFVLGSERNAQEIVFSIGQSFDLAYKRFLEKSGKEMDAQKQFLLLQKQVRELQTENTKLKRRIAELEAENAYTSVVANAKKKNEETVNGRDRVGSYNGAGVTSPSSSPKEFSLLGAGSLSNGTGGAPAASKPSDDIMLLASPPPVKPRVPPPSVSPPQSSTSPSVDLLSKDAFGMDEFNPVKVDTELMKVTEQLDDLQSGFSRGLTFGTEDLILDSFDPLSDSTA